MTESRKRYKQIASNDLKIVVCISKNYTFLKYVLI